MKTKTLMILSSIFFTTCASIDHDPFFDSYPGFEIVVGSTQEEFVEFEGELFIGGVKDSVFIPTESIPLYVKGELNRNSNAFYYNDNNNKVFYLDGNNWNPNLNLIKKIPSESYYFLLKISEDRQEIIKWDGDIETAFRIDNTTEYEIIEFPLSIVIHKDKITVGSRTSAWIDRVKTRYNISNDTIRVLPENYEHEPL